jgi:2-amino-4-hydroxy-6-hydroxymethyldihydropteridine diphosphokinase
MARAFLGLGSNEGDSVREVEGALEDLRASGVRVIAVSSLYRTEPVSGPPQDWYVNAVVEVEFPGEPEALLNVCQSIESLHGRKRVERNAPRTLDIDVLLFSDRIVRSDRLEIPHPRLRERRFVLVPLVEIAHQVLDPVSGLTPRELLERCRDEGAVVPLSPVR